MINLKNKKLIIAIPTIFAVVGGLFCALPTRTDLAANQEIKLSVQEKNDEIILSQVKDEEKESTLQKILSPLLVTHKTEVETKVDSISEVVITETIKKPCGGVQTKPNTSPKPECKPEIKPETKPETKPEETPVPTPDVTPETKPEVKPEETPVPTPEIKPDVVPDETPEVTPEIKPETKPEVVPETKPEETPVPTPEIKPEVPDTDTSSEFLAQVEQKVFQLVNEERAKVGLPTLTYNTTMEKYARIKSKDMAVNNYFSHEDQKGNLITVQMKADGVSYNAWGENIAYRSGNEKSDVAAKNVMESWMNSAGHKANILSTNYTSIGVGVYKVGNKTYFTQEFYK